MIERAILVAVVLLIVFGIPLLMYAVFSILVGIIEWFEGDNS
jgi:hypothetical protein